MKKVTNLTSVLLVGFISTSLWAQTTEPALFDFEQGGYDAWTVEGEAFGDRPQTDEDMKTVSIAGSI